MRCVITAGTLGCFTDFIEEKFSGRCRRQNFLVVAACLVGRAANYKDAVGALMRKQWPRRALRYEEKWRSNTLLWRYLSDDHVNIIREIGLTLEKPYREFGVLRAETNRSRIGAAKSY